MAKPWKWIDPRDIITALIVLAFGSVTVRGVIGFVRGMSLVDAFLIILGTCGLATTAWLDNRRRNVRAAHRRQLVKEWRTMVTEIHNQMMMSSDSTAAAFLEKHKSYPSLRPYISARTDAGLFRRTLIVVPDRSTMDGGLHSLLGDIETVEQQWGLDSE